MLFLVYFCACIIIIIVVVATRVCLEAEEKIILQLEKFCGSNKLFALEQYLICQIVACVYV